MKRNKHVAMTLVSIMIAGSVLSGCKSSTETAFERKDQEVVKTEEAVAPTAEAESTPSPEITEDIPADVIEVPKDSLTTYEYFLGMGGNNLSLKAVVDDAVEIGYSDYDFQNVGKEFTFGELTSYLNSNGLAGDNASEPVPYYAFLDIDGEKLLALKYQGMNIYSPGDDSYTIFIIANRDDGLHITASVSAWARQSVSLNAEGYIYVIGSAGAGEDVSSGEFINKDGKLTNIFKGDWVAGSWMFGSDEKISSAYKEVYEGHEEESTNIAIQLYDFNGTKLYMVDQFGGELTDIDKKFIKAMEDEGVEWSTAKDVSDMLKSKSKELRGYEVDVDQPPLMFSKVMESEYMGIPGQSSGWTTGWNYQSIVGDEIVLDKSLKAKLNKAGDTPIEDACELTQYIEFDEEAREDKEEEYFFAQSVDGNSETFKYYITSHMNSVFVTPDGCAVKAEDSFADFIYGTIPTLIPDDFDGDGETELLIEFWVFHGTGFTQDSVAMLDYSYNWEGGKNWKIYHLTPQTYIEDINEKLNVFDMGTDVKVVYEGQESVVSKEGDDSSMTLFLDHRVKESHEGKYITISVTPTLFSDKNPIGLELKTIDVIYEFCEDGEWKEKD